MPVQLSNREYQKICIVDFKPFITKRMNTLYCSRKCANKARSFPRELLEQLMIRVAPCTRVFDRPNKATREFLEQFANNTLGIDRKELNLSSLTGVTQSEIEELEKNALRLAKERGMTPLTEKKLELTSTSNGQSSLEQLITQSSSEPQIVVITGKGREDEIEFTLPQEPTPTMSGEDF